MRIPCRVGREGGREQSQRANESGGRDSNLSCTVNQRSRICPYFFLDGGCRLLISTLSLGVETTSCGPSRSTPECRARWPRKRRLARRRTTRAAAKSCALARDDEKHATRSVDANAAPCLLTSNELRSCGCTQLHLLEIFYAGFTQVCGARSNTQLRGRNSHR